MYVSSGEYVSILRGQYSGMHGVIEGISKGLFEVCITTFNMHSDAYSHVKLTYLLLVIAIISSYETGASEARRLRCVGEVRCRWPGVDWDTTWEEIQGDWDQSSTALTSVHWHWLCVDDVQEMTLKEAVLAEQIKKPNSTWLKELERTGALCLCGTVDLFLDSLVRSIHKHTHCALSLPRHTRISA